MGSRDVIGHVTIRLPGIDFLWVVHSASNIGRTDVNTEKKMEEEKEKEERERKGRVEREKKEKWKGKEKEKE